MADLSITISNTMFLREAVDGDVYSLWGTMVWGTDNWFGEFDTPIEFEQWIALSLSLSQTLGKDVEKRFAESITLSGVTYFSFAKQFNLGINLSVAIAGNAITQGVWTQQAPDVETWTERTLDTETWTEQTAASTTWS